MKNTVATLFVGFSLLTAVPAQAEEALWQPHSASATTHTVSSDYQEVGFRRGGLRRSGFRRGGFRRGGFGHRSFGRGFRRRGVRHGGFRRSSFGKGFKHRGFRRSSFGRGFRHGGFRRNSFGRGFRHGGFRRSNFGKGLRRRDFGQSGFGFISPVHPFDQFHRFDQHHSNPQVFDGKVKAPRPQEADVQAFETDGSLFQMPETQLQTINANEGSTPQAFEDSASFQSLPQPSSTAQ